MPRCRLGAVGSNPQYAVIGPSASAVRSASAISRCLSSGLKILPTPVRGKAATSLIAEALGYETETKVLSVPVTYTGLAEGDIDVFLGNWMPTMEADLAPYRDAGTVETVRVNLEGAKYTLATNEAGAALGLKDFKDIKVLKVL